MKTSDWDDVIKINLSSAFYFSRGVAMKMAKRRTGSIISISSVVGIIGNPGQTNYCASKAGLIGFSKSLAKEVGARGIRVNVIAPGFIETEMTDKLPDAVKDAMKGQIPLGRAGKPEEVAKAALYLASDLSDYVTGHVLKTDGGMAM
jgi:3-oxoacyl-[acyl-carrier protein] reductase